VTVTIKGIWQEKKRGSPEKREIRIEKWVAILRILSAGTGKLNRK